MVNVADVLNLPPPSLNGGRYTGQPFQKDAPWGNFPALPDAGYLNTVALRSADPPPGAQYHIPGGGLRPGNNTPVLPTEMTAMNRRVKGLNVVCMPEPQDKAARNDEVFRGFAYI
jgi:hypothetical protein